MSLLLAAELLQPPNSNEDGGGLFLLQALLTAPRRKTWDVLTIATSQLFQADPWRWWIKQLWFGLFFMTELACVCVCVNACVSPGEVGKARPEIVALPMF